ASHIAKGIAMLQNPTSTGSSKLPVGSWYIRAPRRGQAGPNVPLLAREFKGFEFGSGI
ncbi:Hypothetical predicted protein, partial [Olea europaea subsp. europaea]